MSLYLANALSDAQHLIDLQFGKGYAAKHPELIGACIQCAGSSWIADSIIAFTEKFVDVKEIA